MPNRILPSFLASIALGLGVVTSAKDKIEFTTIQGESMKGELIGSYNGIVYIDRGRGKTSLLAFRDLDEASRKPIVKWFDAYLSNLKEEPRGVSESDSELTKFLSDKLQIWQNGELVDYEFASKPEPEFFAFYYSAHWCGPCRRFTPKLRAFYNAMKLVGYDNFEVIFVSSDSSKGMMKQYMEEDQMPWPALKYSKRSNRLIAKYKGSGIPCLVVTDRYGNLLAHSYRGDEYLGPSSPKGYLQGLLKYTAALKKKTNDRTEK